MGLFNAIGSKVSAAANWLGSKVGNTLSSVGSKVSNVANVVGNAAARVAPVAALVAPEIAPLVAGVAAGAKAVQGIAQGASNLGEALKNKNPEQALASGKQLVDSVNDARVRFQARGGDR